MVGIRYKSRALTGSSSLDDAPVTGSLLFYAPVCRFAVCCAAGISLWVLFGDCDSIWLALFRLFFRRVSVDCLMATDSDATARAGLASRLMSRWRFPGTLWGQLYIFSQTVWWIWTRFWTSWALLAGGRKPL